MKKNIWVIVVFVLFYLLELWPVFGLLSYTIFSTELRTIIAFSIVFIEFCLGLFCMWWTIKERKNKSRTKFIVHISIVSFFYLVFLGAFSYFFIIPK